MLSEHPEPSNHTLDELLGQLRAGDLLVIWKLDRLGRPLKHLVELVGDLVKRKVGLLSLNDPIDRTPKPSVGLSHFIALLDRTGCREPIGPALESTPADCLLTEYERHMCDVQGLAPTTSS